jgi:putative ABC transport system permease protein
MGRILRSLKLGMKSLLLHKLRSGLTILGIVFGVAAVISMLAVGEGTSREQQERLQALGAVNVIYRSVKPTEESQASGGGRPGRTILNYGLKYDDFNRLLATVPTIKKALPIREVPKEVRHLNRAIEGRVVGTTHLYADFNRLKMERGRFLSEADNEHFENYAVLGASVAQKLFPYEDPLRQTVKLGSDYYTVIGVTQARAGTAAIGGSLAGQEYNKDVYIPLNTCRLRFGERILENRAGTFTAEETQLSQITMQLGEVKDVRPSAPIIEAAVKPWHPKKDVELVVPLDLIEEAERTARQWAFVLGTIASISLLVGGIGIMNIMLATVTERTREIGIRRALGAKRRDITEQFLIESVVLSGVGGILGVCLGVTIPFLIVHFAQMKAFITPHSVLLAFGISVGVGILFGLYPAQRAAQMDPIDALRHE